MLYKLNEPIVAVRIEFTSRQDARVALSRGAILKVQTTPAAYDGLMEAEWEGQRIRVYGQDLASRATLLLSSADSE